MGIILEIKDGELITAEGNTFNDNISGILRRPINEHIRAYIRIPDGYKYGLLPKSEIVPVCIKK